jgi:hypothetical protein
MKDEQNKKRLTMKQQLFVEHYLSNGGNGVAACRSAGYTGSDETLRAIASENLTKLHIMKQINQRIADSGVSGPEVLGTLASQMRADMGELMPDNPIVARAKEKGVSHWIKKLIVKKRSWYDKERQATVHEEESQVELYSAFTAAKQLSVILGLEKLPASNPVDMAKQAYEQLCGKYPEKPTEKIARAVAENFGIDESEFVK